MSRRPVRSLLAAVVLVIAGATALVWSSPPLDAGSTGAVGPIDTSDRREVAASYTEHVLENLTLRSGWTGSTENCWAGDADASFDLATIEAVNWFRRMAGLRTVIEDPGASAAAQDAALMMDAADALSHHPSGNWPCHTTEGAQAAGQSNLTLGIAGPRGVIGQVQDPGGGNEALGHRRWLLFPPLAEIGVGNTQRVGVIHVIGSFRARAPGSRWVAWPPSGFVPDAMVFDRWSLSFGGKVQADFSDAVVSMTENGRAVRVEQYPVANGYGDNTIAWHPVGIDPDGAGDRRYTVTVTGIVADGRRLSHTYTVTAFDPHAPAPSAETAEISPTIRPLFCRGREATIVGSDGDDVLVGSEGDDVIVGLGGNDVIHGGGGHDVICAGRGHDRVYGGAGADLVLGGSGRDTLQGGSGNDTMHGQGGRDRITGNQGRDVLSGGGDIDAIVGNAGRDTCWASTASTRGNVASETFRACERVG